MKTSDLCKSSILLAILAMGIFSTLQAQNPEAQFQQGLIKEEGEGSLLEAIEIYNKVAGDQAAGRTLQAEALLHVGMCYEKLGRKEAEKAYRKLIQDYPEQTEVTVVARKKLSLLSQTTKADSQMNLELKIRKVWEGADKLLGELSPDGKFISYTDWETGDLAVYDITSGQTSRLTSKGTWQESDAYSEDSRWSPDSRQIAYGWSNDTGAYELRIITLGESEPVILYTNKEVNYLVPRDWSPDGREILVLLNFWDRSIKAVLISVADGTVKTIKNCEIWPNNMGFSSDGQYIIYSAPSNNRSGNRDIFCIHRDGNTEYSLIAHPSDDIVQGWTPDGKTMLFSSDRDGSMGLYTIEFSEGRIRGTPALVKSGVEPYESLGFSPEGSYYYAISKDWNDVYVAELDPEGTEKVKQVTKMTSRYEGNNKTPDYSPDGNFLAYVTSQNNTGLNASPTWGDKLVIRKLESGQEEVFNPEFTHIGYPRWSPDGNSILTVYRNLKTEFGVFLLDRRSGQIETIGQPKSLNQGFGRHDWSPDGSSFYIGNRDQETNTSGILCYSFSEGTDKVIYESMNTIWQVFLSPDGKRLAFIDKAEAYGLSVIPSGGGDPTVLFRLAEGEPILPGTNCSVAWSPDNRYLYFTLRDGRKDENPWELCRIPAEGGEIEKLGLALPRPIANLCIHPDGRHIAYSTTSAPITPAVWVIENFLPDD